MEDKYKDLTKNFDLATILSVTTGRRYADMGDIYELLEHMTRFSQINPRDISSEQIGEIILKQHPQLRGVGKKEKFKGKDNDEIAIEVDKFLMKQKLIYGEELPIRPVLKSDLENTDEDVKEDGTSIKK